jgi:hypothetical protein
MPTALQYNMFGPPEDVSSVPQGATRDDAPVPCERELLWPAPHAAVLGPDLLERLYGDLPRRTRLTVGEVCRRLRRGHSHIYDLVEAGSLDGCDDRHPSAVQQALTIYRYSLVRFLFNREFVTANTRCGLPSEDLDKCMRLAEALKTERRRYEK